MVLLWHWSKKHLYLKVYNQPPTLEEPFRSVQPYITRGLKVLNITHCPLNVSVFVFFEVSCRQYSAAVVGFFLSFGDKDPSLVQLTLLCSVNLILNF